jgi:hypothetical protein
MTAIDCTQLDDLLFDASPLAMETAARHAEHCPDCAQTLAGWNDLTATAQSMREETWQNELLWPRIARALEQEKQQDTSRQKRTASRWLRQIAAGLILTVALGGTMSYALRLQTHDAAFDRDILRLDALDEVERAEQSHVAAIERLEQLAGAKLEEPQSSLMTSYKEKLMLLDDAIAECQANIDQNRQNAHLRKQLLTMYSEKQVTLQDVLREDSHVSHP